MPLAIAIDGPAGAGKSTIARLVAKEVNAEYINTGAMYRAVAYYVIRKGLDAGETQAVLSCLPEIDIAIGRDGDKDLLYLNGQEVFQNLNNEKVSRYASSVSAIGEVREKLVALQRELAKKTDVVMDGRDIGTTVLPDAQLKIYLTADARERARRRLLQYEEKKEEHGTLEQILEDLLKRDHNDMTRAISPLCKASDAIEIDSTNMSMDEVVHAVLTLVDKVKEA